MTDDTVEEMTSPPHSPPISFAHPSIHAVALAIVLLWIFLPRPGEAHLVYYGDNIPPPTSLSSLQAYEFMGFEIPEEAFPLSVVLVGQPPDGLTGADAETALRRAMDAWNDVPCSYARFEWGGLRHSAEDVADDEIAVQFSDDFEAIPHTLALFTGPHPAPPLGIDIFVNTLTYDWILDPQPMPDFHDAHRPTAVLPAALTHELGHVLGLDHTQVHNAATMAAHYLVDGSQSELSADDKLGLCELYPRHGSECLFDEHCPPAAPCVSGEYGRVCDIPLADIGEYCALDLQHCPGFCQIESHPTGTGFCTISCTGDAQCPDHFRCADKTEDESHCRLDSDSLPPPNGCSAASRPRDPTVLLALSLFFVLAIFRRRLTTRSVRAR